MVRRRVALAVQRLAAEAIENVDFSGVGKCLKGPIHSCEPDALAFIDDATVNVAGRGEPRKVSEGIFDGCPLAGGSDADCLTAWCRSHVILLLSVVCSGRESVVVWLALWSVSKRRVLHRVGFSAASEGILWCTHLIFSEIHM